MSAPAYPLQWPMGWPRTRFSERHPSMARNFVRNRDGVVRQLELLGATDMVVSSNLTTRVDGLPYANQREPEDPGVAVYFKLNGNEQCIPCDKWDNTAQNMRAIALTIEALRGIERWGAKEMVNAAFRGFKALPGTIIMGEHTARAWWEVLQVSSTADMDVIEAAYKRLLHKVHPDKGGSDYAFQEVQNAFRQAKEAVR
jgi:hypothetical protein